MEKEGRFDKLRKYLNYFDIASIFAGAMLGMPALAMGGVMSLGMDQSLGKEASRWLKKRKQNSKNK